jgi:hypothetical protein
MIDIIRLFPHQMDERDKLDLIRFSESDYNGRSAADFIEAILQDLFQMWRVSEGETRGLLITKVLATARGSRTLYVEGIGGVGFVKRPGELTELLFQLARKGDCKSVTGWVQRPGMLRWMESAGLPLVASVFMKEVPDAPQELAEKLH